MFQVFIGTRFVTISFTVRLLACSKYYYIIINWSYFRVRSTLSIGVTPLNTVGALISPRNMILDSTCICLFAHISQWFDNLNKHYLRFIYVVWSRTYTECTFTCCRVKNLCIKQYECLFI